MLNFVNKNSFFFKSIPLLMIFIHISTTVLAQQIPIMSETIGQGINKKRTLTEIKSLMDDPNNKDKLKSIKEDLSSSMSGFGVQNQKIKIHVLGDVQTPGVFTATVSDRMTDILDKAKPNRESQRLIEVRHPGENTTTYDLYNYNYQGNLNDNPYLQDNDVIFVPPAKGSVRIEGPVARPGIYELANEKNILDIITLAGGASAAASRKYMIRVIRFADEGKKSILEITNNKSELRNFKIQKGDIIIIPDIVNNPENFDYSVENIPGENLFYPTATPNVFVAGAVSQAGAFPYKSHLKIKDYVAYASPSEFAQLRSVLLVRNGKSHLAKFDEKPIPGDMIQVKAKPHIGAIVAAVSTALSLTLTTLLLRDQLRNN